MATKSATLRGDLMRSYAFALDGRLAVAAVAALSLILATAPAEAACSKSVTLYSASWCPYCKQVRGILARNHIQYSLLDATTPSVQAVMRELFGDTSVPRTVIGGVVVEGVDEDRIKELCQQRPIEHAPLPSVLDIKLPSFPPSRHDAERPELEQVARLQVSIFP
jgi:glutaredoxin 3